MKCSGGFLYHPSFSLYQFVVACVNRLRGFLQKVAVAANIPWRSTLNYTNHVYRQQSNIGQKKKKTGSLLDGRILNHLN